MLWAYGYMTMECDQSEKLLRKCWDASLGRLVRVAPETLSKKMRVLQFEELPFKRDG